MARVIGLDEARELGLPGRISREILAGATDGAALTVRHVEIPPAQPGASREPHSHSDSEECIHVLAGEGAFWTEQGETPVKAGDTIHVPPGERHYTRNTGSGPLVLLCVFPTARLGKHG